MSYDTVVKFSASRKTRTIKGAFRSSNSYDHWGRRIVSEQEWTFETEEEFEKGLLSFANGHLDGTTPFSPSSTMGKRISWLLENGYAKRDEYGWGHFPETEEVLAVVSGRKKIKVSQYTLESGTHYCRKTRSGVRLYPKEYYNGRNGKPQKFSKQQAENLLEWHKDFFEQHNVVLKEVV